MIILPSVRNVGHRFRSSSIMILSSTMILNSTTIFSSITMAGVMVSRAIILLPRFGITPRSIPLCIIFTLITCGIYGIYWMIKLNDEVNIVSGEPQATSGGIVFLLTIVTCGIYGLYWLYKMGERCDRIKGVNGSSGILYLILGLVGFSIISYCLIQDTLNKAA